MFRWSAYSRCPVHLAGHFSLFVIPLGEATLARKTAKDGDCPLDIGRDHLQLIHLQLLYAAILRKKPGGKHNIERVDLRTRIIRTWANTAVRWPAPC